MSAEQRLDSSKEMTLMQQLDHKYIVKMHDCFYTIETKTFNILLELCENGDLG